MGFPSLDPLIALSLKNPFTEKEIFSALKEYDDNNALGSDAILF